MTTKKTLSQLLPEPTKAVEVTKLAERIADAKVLTIDIETSPNIAHVWSLWKQNIGLAQLLETGGVISFAAKWYGRPKVLFHSDFHDGHDEMINKAWQLMNEADVLVHFNGLTFDVPHLHREFLLADLTPPAPHRDIDLLQVAKKRFRFASNKLDHLANQLGLGAKVHHAGHELWVKCLAGDEQAWSMMRRYNKHDVVLTEKLLIKLRSWIKHFPAIGSIDDVEHLTCNNCGGEALVRYGEHRTPMMIYPRYQCADCGTWRRGRKAIGRASATHGI